MSYLSSTAKLKQRNIRAHASFPKIVLAPATRRTLDPHSRHEAMPQLLIVTVAATSLLLPTFPEAFYLVYIALVWRPTNKRAPQKKKSILKASVDIRKIYTF